MSLMSSANTQPAAPSPPQPAPARAPRRAGLVLSTIAIVAAGAVLWAVAIKPNVVPKNFGVVAEGKVYRSGWLTPAATERVVKRHKIRTIVDLGAYDKRPEMERSAERTASALGVDRYVFRLEGDGTGNPNIYVAALRIITDPSKQPVLVHCSAGAQRTSGCILLYRNIVEGRSFSETVHEAFDHKHDPSDNPRLLPYLLDWHDDIERAFRAPIGDSSTAPWIPGHEPVNPLPAP